MYKHGAWLSLVKVTQCILTMKVEHTCTDMGLYFFACSTSSKAGKFDSREAYPETYPRNTPQNFMARHEKRVHMLHIRLDLASRDWATYSSNILLHSSKLLTNMAGWKIDEHRLFQ